jgi:Bacterial Ig-like domain (group 1)
MRPHWSTRPRAGALLLASVVCGCSDGAGPPAPAQVQATGGGGQVAPVHSLLPEPIVATVLDAAGQPVQGVSVVWAAEGDGRITALTHMTDALGQARARWVLGGTIGTSHATAAVEALEPATFTAVAESPEYLPYNEVHLLDLATYEGSRQVVHPDYVRVPTDAFPSAHHLAFTPYPFGNASQENPSHFVGDRLDLFAAEPGAPNPVVRPSEGHLSDPDLLYVPESRELWLYYRQVTSDNIILLTRSGDGLRWTPPVEVARAPNHQVVSQTVVRRGPGDWWMYAVNAGEEGCSAPSSDLEVRRSMDGIHWSAPAPTPVGSLNRWPWHVEVQWVPTRNEFWAIYNVKGNGDCASPALFLATSPDGYTWTILDRPVLIRGTIPALADIVYRSSFHYEPESDAIVFWYSGARHNGQKYVWSAAVERRRRSDVFAPSVVAEEAGLRWGEAPERLLEGP